MHFRFHSVYSLLAEPATLPSDVAAMLPAGMQLSQHQLDTYTTLTGRTHPVALNEAMTGDVKSLALYLPTLVHARRHALALYPTIELSRDQYKQFGTYATLFGRTFQYDALWGTRLGALVQERSAKRRADILKERFTNCQVILTNPDIFHLVMNYRYGSGIYSDQELPYTLATNFDDCIFDEFHIFSLPQIVSTITAMLFFLESAPSDAPMFLFSSATPDPLFLKMMNRADIPYHQIHGTYSDKGGSNYRQVLHPSELTIHKCGEDENVETWLHRNMNVILAHWRNATQKPKGAIILNSVVTARRVTQMLKNELCAHGISVEEVSGLTDDKRRRMAMEQADLVVGTSTIDVGIDFHISFLLFETLDAGNFLQRFGRLGRVRMNGHSFDHYEAHALISHRTPWIYDRIERSVQKHKDGFKDGDTIDRPETFREIITDLEVFSQVTHFLPYAKRWGILQAAHVITTLRGTSHQGGFQSLADALEKRYEALFQIKSFKSAIGRYRYLVGGKHHQQEPRQSCQIILDEILSFRGNSPFHTAVWDSTIPVDAFIGYDALPLIQNTQYDVIDEQRYKQAIERLPQSLQENALEALRQSMKGKADDRLILHITDFVQNPDALLLGWDGRSGVRLRDWKDQVVALKGCIVQEPRLSQDIDVFNRFLRLQWLVCYITRKEIKELRLMLRLPPYFQLYRIEQLGKTYTIAFGKTALLLEAEMVRFRGKDEEQEAIFC